MPIIYVHGVANRDESQFKESIEPRLRKYIAPRLAAEASSVSIEQAFWGKFGAHFAFDGLSRPPTEIFGQGASNGLPITALGLGLSLSRAASSELMGGQGAANTLTVDFDGMPVEQQVLLMYQVLSEHPYPENGQLVMQIETILRSAEGRNAVARESTIENKVKAVAALVGQECVLTGMGPAWLDRIGQKVKTTLSNWSLQALRPVGDLLGEIRPLANELVIQFFGDIFEYFRTRTVLIDGKERPGPIMSVVLDRILAAHQIKKATGEPIVIMTHSMGGQLVYDAVTYFAEQDPELQDLVIDLWAAAASQVALFEELRMFRVSKSDSGPNNRPVPPPRVKRWWSVWDEDDWLSYTVTRIFAPVYSPERGVFEGVRDEKYDGRLPFPWSHSGYPNQDKFYDLMAKRLEDPDWH